MWNCITVSALESLLQTSKINTLPGQQTLRNCPSNSMTVYVIGTLAVAAVCASCQAVLLCCYPPAHRDRQTLHCFQVPIQRAGITRPWWTTRAIPPNISLAKALPLVRRSLLPRPCARCIPTGSLTGSLISPDGQAPHARAGALPVRALEPRRCGGRPAFVHARQGRGPFCRACPAKTRGKGAMPLSCACSKKRKGGEGAEEKALCAFFAYGGGHQAFSYQEEQKGGGGGTQKKQPKAKPMMMVPWVV